MDFFFNFAKNFYSSFGKSSENRFEKFEGKASTIRKIFNHILEEIERFSLFKIRFLLEIPVANPCILKMIISISSQGE